MLVEFPVSSNPPYRHRQLREQLSVFQNPTTEIFAAAADRQK